MSRSYYKNDPYRTTARFGSTCPDCTKPIKKGAPISVWPSSPTGKKARHEVCSETDMRRFEAAAQDEYTMTSGGYY